MSRRNFRCNECLQVLKYKSHNLLKLFVNIWKKKKKKKKKKETKEIIKFIFIFNKNIFNIQFSNIKFNHIENVLISIYASSITKNKNQP